MIILNISAVVLKRSNIERLIPINYIPTVVGRYTLYRVGQKEVHRDYRLVLLNGTCQIYDFCTKVVQKVAKQMPVNLVQDNVKYQGKYVLCRDMHFGHNTAGN